MAEQSTPAQKLKHAYAIWSQSKGSDPQPWFALIDDRVELRSVLHPDLPDDLAAIRTSRAGVEEYFATIGRDWEMVSFDVERLIDGGDDVVMVGRCAFRNRATGRLVDTPKVDVWRFEDGRAVSYLEMFDSLGFIRATPMGPVLE
jgi:ketosteroid isomerase-like protein